MPDDPHIDVRPLGHLVRFTARRVGWKRTAVVDVVFDTGITMRAPQALFETMKFTAEIADR